MTTLANALIAYKNKQYNLLKVAYSQNVTALDNSIKYIQPSWSGKLNRAGLTGTVECVGLVDPMIPLLILGSYFNAGKGASYGSGFHQIEVE